MRESNKFRILHWIIFSGWATLLALSASGQTLYPYVIEDLGTLGGSTSAAFAINNFGQVAGAAAIGNDTEFHAFRYADTWGMQDLGTLNSYGHNLSKGYAINDKGQVAGWSGTFFDEGYAFRYTDGLGLEDLGTPNGWNTEAQGINTSGDVVGFAYLYGDNYRAWVYTDTDGIQLIPLGAWMSRARAINDAGQITGEIFTYDVGRAFRYSKSMGLEMLPSPPGDPFVYAAGEDINQLGQVFGDGGGVYETEVFRFSDDSGSEVLESPPGSLGAYAWGVNNHGDAVATFVISGKGDRAYLHSRQRGWRDLNDLIPPDTGWVLMNPYAINDKGQIVGYGLHNGVGRAFRMTPNPNYKGPQPSGPPTKR